MVIRRLSNVWNNPSLGSVNVSAYANVGQLPFVHSQAETEIRITE